MRDRPVGAMIQRERRSELMARSEPSALLELAGRCLRDDTRVTSGPTVGTVPLCVREPVVGERFLLADVLVTHAEVEHLGQRGWAMRLGDDGAAAVAAAICDAEAAANGGMTAAIDSLCAKTEVEMRDRDRAEWAELAPTVVRFEELDQ